MPDKKKKYRFRFIKAFSLPSDSRFVPDRGNFTKEQRMANFDNYKHLLDDVEWDFHEGPVATYGDWPVETREEYSLVGAGRCQIVREACESGKYNGIILLGGGDPGFLEAREIARGYNIPVTACAWSQMQVASMLGNKFSLIELSDNGVMYFYDLITRYNFAPHCASIRNINYVHPRRGYPAESIMSQREKALRGEKVEAVERAVTEAIDAIENDGAEGIIFGCSAGFWLQPYLQKRLLEIGWEAPVLEGYSCATSLAKTMVDLKVDTSGLFFPGVRPKKWRRKKVF